MRGRRHGMVVKGVSFYCFRAPTLRIEAPSLISVKNGADFLYFQSEEVFATGICTFPKGRLSRPCQAEQTQ